MTMPPGGQPGFTPDQPYGQQPGSYPSPPPPNPPGYPQQPYPQQPYGQPYPQQPYGQPYPGTPMPPPPYGSYQLPQTGFGTPASMGSRLLARIIDGFIVGIPVGVIIAIAVASLSDKLTCDDNNLNCTVEGGVPAWLIILYVLAVCFALGYELFFIGTRGATPGKKMMGVKVVDATTGSPIGVGRAFVRYLVLSITGSLCTLGYWSPFFDSSRRYQGWHDKAASDFVVTSK